MRLFTTAGSNVLYVEGKVPNSEIIRVLSKDVKLRHIVFGVSLEHPRDVSEISEEQVATWNRDPKGHILTARVVFPLPWLSMPNLQVLVNATDLKSDWVDALFKYGAWNRLRILLQGSADLSFVIGGARGAQHGKFPYSGPLNASVVWDDYESARGEQL